MTHIPPYHELMNPTLVALHNLGGSGTIQEIYESVVEKLALPDDVLEILHNPNRGGQTEIEYRLSWARTYLKHYGILENSARGIWALTSAGKDAHSVDTVKVRRHVADLIKNRSNQKETLNSEIASPDNAVIDIDEEIRWQDEVLGVIRNMSPDAFERLIQRLLREAGFIQVEVTGKTGDGGIDGKGIMRIGGFLSFHVIFQCKRYTGAVSSSQIRDFRGAMVGRADKGLLVTTGNFTREAVREATRDGAPTIDLIDGEFLADKLKEFGLGIRT